MKLQVLIVIIKNSIVKIDIFNLLFPSILHFEDEYAKK